MARDDAAVPLPQPQPRNWPIRAATLDDAQAISDLHRAAILTACASWYSPTQIRAWVGRVSPEVHAELQEHRRVRVAIDDGAICGFSAMSVADELINALYVAPFAMHQGVGQALLADAEEALLAAGRHEVQLHATLNAVDFYRWLGYVDVGEVTNRLPGGVGLAAVQMRKSLV